MKIKSIITSSKLLNIAVLLGFIGLWHVTATLVDSPYFADVFKTGDAFISLAKYGDIDGYSLLTHIEVSLIRVGAGFALACLIGVPMGLIMGLYTLLYESSKSVIEPIRFIPPIAWIPLAIVLLRGLSRYAFIVWLGAFFPIFINTLTSIPRVNQIHVNVAKVYGADKGYVIWHIVIPSVLPEVLAGMRVGLGVGWMCIMAAEMIGGEMVGLGRMIYKYSAFPGQYPGEMLVGMILIGIIGLAMNEALIQIEKRLFRWRWEVVV